MSEVQDEGWKLQREKCTVQGARWDVQALWGAKCKVREVRDAEVQGEVEVEVGKVREVREVRDAEVQGEVRRVLEVEVFKLAVAPVGTFYVYLLYALRFVTVVQITSQMLHVVHSNRAHVLSYILEKVANLMFWDKVHSTSSSSMSIETGRDSSHFRFHTKVQSWDPVLRIYFRKIFRNFS